MPVCKNHPAFYYHSPRRTATTAAASTESATVDSPVLAGSTKLSTRRVSVSTNASPSDLDPWLAELAPGSALNLLKVKSCGALMARKWSYGLRIQQGANWISERELPKCECRDDKDRNEQGSNSSTRPNSRLMQGKLKAWKSTVQDSTCMPTQSNVLEEKGASHECVLAG